MALLFPLSKWRVERIIKGYPFWLRLLTFRSWGIHFILRFFFHGNKFSIIWSKSLWEEFFFVYRLIWINSWSNWFLKYLERISAYFFFFEKIEIRLIKKKSYNFYILYLKQFCHRWFIHIHMGNEITLLEFEKLVQAFFWKTKSPRQFRYFRSYHEFHLASNDFNISGSTFILQMDDLDWTHLISFE